MLDNMILDVDMIDGRKYTDIRVLMPDLIRYEDVAQRHKWGTIQESPLRGITFAAYAALVRTGQYDGDKGFPEFCNEVAMVYKQDDEEGVDPTPAVASTDF